MSIIFDTRFIKFGLVGLSGMCLDFAVTWLCKEKLRVNKYLANSLGFGCAVCNNFLLNRYWTFKNNSIPLADQFTKFVLVAVTGLLINNILLFLLTRSTQKNFYFLKLIVIGLIFCWNFFVNSLYTFK